MGLTLCVTSHDSVSQSRESVPRGGGGHSGTEWLPTAKRPRGARAVNGKIWGQSTHLKAGKGGGQLQTKNQIRVVTWKMCFFSIYFVKYMILIT